METGTTWRKRIFLLGFLVLAIVAVAISLVVTERTSPLYKTAVKIEADPSAILAAQGFSINQESSLFSTYEARINDDSFEAEVVGLVAKKPGNRFATNSFGTVSISADTVPNTNILAISVMAGNPQLAADVANTSAEVLIKAEGKRLSQSTDTWSKGIHDNKIKNIDRKLSDLRFQLEAIRNDKHLSNSEQPLKTAAVQDEIDAVKSTRKTYTDFLDRVKLAELANQNSLNILSPAPIPRRPFKPNMLENLAIAILASVLTGILLVLAEAYARPKG